jgi:AraC-like DNA-binding protein
MRYSEYAPDRRLVDVVRCYWVFEAAFDIDAPDERIVPDGSPELIFHYEDPFLAVLEDRQRAQVQPRHLLAGQLTRPLMLRSRGRAGLIGVRFTPWGARRLFRMPMSEMTDRYAGIDALGAAWLARVDGEIDGCADDRARIALIERTFLDRLAASGTPPRDGVAIDCANALLQAGGRIAIDALVARTSLSHRQLERRFNDTIGMPPRMFASIARFRALFDALSGDAPPDWLGAALDAGYFDQPHMIRDFRRFAGIAPRAFVESLPAFSRAVASF